MATRKKSPRRRTGAAKGAALPTHVTVGGDGKYDEPTADVGGGGGPRVANRGGIFEGTYSKPEKGWFVPVKKKPDQINFAFGFETTGPKDDDAGFKCGTWKNISVDFGKSSKRAGQSQAAWIRDALRSVGVSAEAATKLVPLNKGARLDLKKLSLMLDKRLGGKTGYVKLLASEDRDPYRGALHCSSSVIACVAKEKAEGRIAEETYESEHDPVVKRYLEKGPKVIDEDDDLDTDDTEEEDFEDADEEEDDLEDEDEDLDDEDEDFEDDDE